MNIKCFSKVIIILAQLIFLMKVSLLSVLVKADNSSEISTLATKSKVVSVKDSEVELVSITSNENYMAFKSSLQIAVDEYANQPINHFYIAKFTANSSTTYMLWKEMRTLQILSIGDSKAHWREVILYPNASQVIDLDKDVVATVEEIGSSTYLVDQSWVNQKIFDAVLNGDLIVIEKQSN